MEEERGYPYDHQGGAGFGVLFCLPSITSFDQNPSEVIKTGDWVKVDTDNGIVEIIKKVAGT